VSSPNDSTVQNVLFGSRTAGTVRVLAPYRRAGLPADRPSGSVCPTAMLTCWNSPMMCPTSWDCIFQTSWPLRTMVSRIRGVYPGDSVAIWGAGPIGLMCALFAQKNQAGRVIVIDHGLAARLRQIQASGRGDAGLVTTLHFHAGGTVTAEIHERVPGGGVDVSIECAAGEYAKGWLHYFEMALGMETDTYERDLE
jgi:NADPH:quinone reductase-like Zn-dependent oxidoreductase